MTTLESAKQHIFDRAVSRGVSQKRAEWLANELEDIQRIHGFARAYQIFIQRMIA